jgi:hypothetical protein
MTLTWMMNFSAHCPNVAGAGWRCMICPEEDATGHATVGGGLYDGRCIAVVCPRHAAEEGWPEVKEALVVWAGMGLLDPATGGPGPAGEPEVWHGDHWDAMPREAPH